LRPRVQVSARFLDAPQRSQKGGKVATGFAEHRTVSKQLLEQPQLCVPRKVIMDGNHNDKCLIRLPIMTPIITIDRNYTTSAGPAATSNRRVNDHVCVAPEVAQASEEVCRMEPGIASRMSPGSDYRLP
jgi:hypothetical protein